MHWVWEKSCELRYECRIILVLIDEFFFFILLLLLIFKFWYSVLEHSMRQLKSLLLKLKSPASVWKFNYYYYYFEVKKIIRLFFEKPWLPFIIKKKRSKMEVNEIGTKTLRYCWFSMSVSSFNSIGTCVSEIFIEDTIFLISLAYNRGPPQDLTFTFCLSWSVHLPRFHHLCTWIWYLDSLMSKIHQ